MMICVWLCMYVSIIGTIGLSVVVAARAAEDRAAWREMVAKATDGRPG